ncbi:M23 family metallopeptidase [Actinocorallia longicatena]|uniref:M23 family metallopeptidase n=1 Tax=Actinocorallia longicatena TaxID=111803 RepID=UPI0031D1E86B
MAIAADRVSTAGMIVAVVVALVLLVIVERSLLDVRKPADKPSPPAEAAEKAAGTTPASPQRLESRVAELMKKERGRVARMVYGRQGGDPVVAVTRQTADRMWAFGVAALPVPTSSSAMPQVALFLARWEGRRWRAGLSGTEGFRALLRVVPTRLLPATEIRTLARYSAGPVTQPQLMLPWQIGESRRVTAMPAQMTFDGGDGQVLAASDGLLYRFCTDAAGNGLVVIVNDTGLATEYYRLSDITRVADGTPVRQGDYLGQTGGPGTCGGATAATTLFGLGQGDGDLPLSGRTLGGWRFRDGWAQRGAEKIMPGQELSNFGP